MRLRNQRGVGLVEIMVAVVIVSIGFLAAASMQVQGMRFSQGAYFRSQAYFMASEIIDRMRNNTRAVTLNLYANKQTGSGLTNPDCNNNNCDFTEMVDQDLRDWSASLYNFDGVNNFTPALPSAGGIEARGTIELIQQNEYRVTLFWAENINGDTEEQSLSVNFATEEFQAN